MKFDLCSTYITYRLFCIILWLSTYYSYLIKLVILLIIFVPTDSYLIFFFYFGTILDDRKYGFRTQRNYKNNSKSSHISCIQFHYFNI